jgi:hypothetical protein
MNQTWRLLVLVLGLVSCAPFQAGGIFNPVQVREIGGFQIKVGASASIKIFAGESPRLDVSPAEFYARSPSEILISGETKRFAYLGLARLSGTVLPQGWRLEIGGDGVNIFARSVSVVTGYDTISTTTKIELGEYVIEARLNVPDNTSVGRYSVQARIEARGRNPVLLNWTVEVIPP